MRFVSINLTPHFFFRRILVRRVIFIARGRRKSNSDDCLTKRFTLRTNDFEGDQLVFLAEQAGISVNSYLRNLVMKDYRRYSAKKIREAETQNWL